MLMLNIKKVIYKMSRMEIKDIIYYFNYYFNKKTDYLKRKRKREIKRQINQMLYRKQKLKIIIGSGGTSYPGWIETDILILNILKPENWKALFVPKSINRILAEHVIEHLTERDFRQFLLIAKRYFTAKGKIRIAVPDGFHPNPDYINWVKPGGVGDGAEDHKVIYNYNDIKRILSQEKYDYRLLEYFDEHGDFHRESWDKDDGYIQRSADNDHRNKKEPLSYTSLIFDVWPNSEGST